MRKKQKISQKGIGPALGLRSNLQNQLTQLKDKRAQLETDRVIAQGALRKVARDIQKEEDLKWRTLLV